MAFPSSPTNGQQYTNNGVTYTYSTALTAWQVTTAFVGNDYTVNVVNATSVVSSGNVGGTNLTGTAVSVSGAVTGGSFSTAGNITVTTSATISNSLAVGATTPSGTIGEGRFTNAITAYYSDGRLKNRIAKIENALDKIDQLTGFIYTQSKLAEQFGYNDYSEQVGLDAGAVKIVQPQAVKIAPFDANPDGTSISGENYLTVMYERLIPLLVEGIKELRAEIKTLKGE